MVSHLPGKSSKSKRPLELGNCEAVVFIYSKAAASHETVRGGGSIIAQSYTAGHFFVFSVHASMT